MQRLARYHAVVDQMIAAGTAYRCYCTPEELDAMREAQRPAAKRPRYDGRWRPAPGKVLPPVPEGVKPVVRFRQPAGRRGHLGRPGQGPDQHQQRPRSTT
jgi:glutamyl-tRNA synthetase